MNLAANIINQISNTNGITKPQGFDLNDETFAKILEGVSGGNNPVTNSIQPLGAPAGFEIEPFGEVETIKETTQITEPIEIKEIDLSDNFSNLIKSNMDNNDFMHFARKQATNAYNMFGKSFVADLKEFVQDTASMI